MKKTDIMDNSPPQPATASPAQKPLTGRTTPPGDKSISHRALILGALAQGQTEISGLLESHDILATAHAVQALGAAVRRHDNGTWVVTGCGTGGLKSPEKPLDFGNSGTAARLLMGAIAGHPITAHCCGDASLSARPMGRVIDPLSQMGARFEAANGNTKAAHLPLILHGAPRALPLAYTLPVPSAQVKSAILLAGLNAAGQTIVTEPQPSRDHTERLLRLFGAVCETTQTDTAAQTTLKGQTPLHGTAIDIAGDPSSAAFVVMAALLVPRSRITLTHILTNPHRDGLWHTLREMGAAIETENTRTISGETVTDMTITASALTGIDVPATRAVSMIDEYPILAIAAACAKGQTRLHGLGELRVKESDRLAAIINGLRVNGVVVDEKDDGMVIHGAGDNKPEGGGVVQTHFDHRIAMSFLVLGLAAQKPVQVDDTRMIATSFPNFFALMATLGADFERQKNES